MSPPLAFTHSAVWVIIPPADARSDSDWLLRTFWPPLLSSPLHFSPLLSPPLFCATQLYAPHLFLFLLSSSQLLLTLFLYIVLYSTLRHSPLLTILLYYLLFHSALHCTIILCNTQLSSTLLNSTLGSSPQFSFIHLFSTPLHSPLLYST